MDTDEHGSDNDNKMPDGNGRDELRFMCKPAGLSLPLHVIQG